jgi:mono/diheme cytochrome c family protein
MRRARGRARARAWFAWAIGSAIVSADPASPQAAGPETWDTPTLYQRACAACHGTDGAGLPEGHPNRASFDPPPADLTDPLFNSREPAADWFLVVKHGGARSGLSKQMPAFETALSDQLIRDLVGYLKSLVDTSRYPPGELNFLRPIVTTKAFPEDEALVITRFETAEEPAPDSLRTTLYYARRLGSRYQGEVKLSTLDAERAAAELDELELGFKWALGDDPARRAIYTVGLEVALPIEDSSASEEAIPYLSFGTGLSDRFTFQSQLRAVLPVDDPGAGEGRLSGIVHWRPSVWRRSVSPALEVVWTEPFESDLESEVSLVPQLFAGLSKLGHVALAAGAELPLTDGDYDYRIHLFVLWDIADGPFWRGW